MKKLCILASFLLATPAFAADEQKLTVEQVIRINTALLSMNCGDRVIKDGAKESMICDPYKWSPGLNWLIATNQSKTQEIATRYGKLRNQAVAKVVRKPDGNPTEEAAAKFAVEDQEQLDIKIDIALWHFRGTDLEPMNLPPKVISGLLPIIDSETAK